MCQMEEKEWKRKIKKIRGKKGEDDMWHGGGKWGEAYPTFDQFVG